MGCMYSMTFPSGKQYIGITSKTAEKRWEAHQAKSRENLPYQAVQAAIRKYGAKSVVLETLIIADDWDYLCLMEVGAIKAFNTMSPHGYNLTSGGEGVIGNKITEEQRVKYSAAQKKRYAKDGEAERLKLASAKGRQVMLENAEAKRINGLAPWRWRKKSTTLKATLGPEKFRELHSELTKAAAKRPDVAAKLSFHAKQRAANPEWRKKIGDARRGQKLGAMTDAHKEKIAAARRAEWQDPVIRERRIKALAVARLAKKNKQDHS